jgi:isopentenyl-diphosphate delta-isomerase
LSDGISQRKRDHLDLCAEEAVEFSTKTTLFDQVDLVHDALPELALGDIALETTLLGKRLRAPLLITGMTGGTDEAAQINQDLARVAEDCGIAFGLGSQRAMLRSPDLSYTFEVRAQAPTTLVLANLGVVQATSMPTAAVDALVRAVAADALCIHLNPAQELVQPGGDRDFRGGLETVRRLATDLRVPVVVKETGCGISRAVARRLVDAGIRTVDVSGAGGTSWVRVETLRAGEPAATLGREFAEWGIPTAAAVLAVRDLGLDCIASGGLRSGLDVAKAVALGARVAGVALPVLRAHREGGAEGARRVVERVLAGLRMAMLLTGARDLDALRRAPVVLGDSLRAWATVGDGNE